MPIDLTQFISRVIYDPESGGLFSKRYGTRYSSRDRDGYIRIRIDGKCIGAHRLAWACFYGQSPNGEVDHINGIRDDNRISNLRVVTRSENMQNAKTPRTNSSGFHGVSWCKSTSRWTAQIWINRKRYRLGSFHSPELAHEAYLNAKYKLHKLCPSVKGGKLLHKPDEINSRKGDINNG